jgi:hypothetical protein
MFCSTAISLYSLVSNSATPALNEDFLHSAQTYDRELTLSWAERTHTADQA